MNLSSSGVCEYVYVYYSIVIYENMITQHYKYQALTEIEWSLLLRCVRLKEQCHGLKNDDAWKHDHSPSYVPGPGREWMNLSSSDALCCSSRVNEIEICGAPHPARVW